MHKGEVGRLGVDVVMCDEAHQLKNTEAQITQAVSQLATKRRLLISGVRAAALACCAGKQQGCCCEASMRKSRTGLPGRAPINLPARPFPSQRAGTPIQNDLSEFHAVYDVACPGLLGNTNDFRRKVRGGAATAHLVCGPRMSALLPSMVLLAPPLPPPRAQYELPIQRGRDADASEAQVERGLAAMNDLMELCNKFMLRRTSTVLKKLLPAKVEQVRGPGFWGGCRVLGRAPTSLARSRRPPTSLAAGCSTLAYLPKPAALGTQTSAMPSNLPPTLPRWSSAA